MATSTGNFVCDNSSLANFKSWAQAISNALSGFGWVQTGDTGQVNWGTIGAVPSSTYVYEIWKANDASAATLPIYLKIEYGFSSTIPRIRITTGTSSNGSGTITGAVGTSTPWQISQEDTNHGASTFPCFFSGDAGQFRAYMWQNVAGLTGVCFGIERSRDSSGNVTTDYFSTLHACSDNVTARQQATLSTSLVSNLETGIIGLGGTSGSNTGAFNGTVAALPVIPILGKAGNPMLGFQTCWANDVSDGATVTVASLYGGTHTFVAFSKTNLSSCIGMRSNNNASMALLMLYE